VKIRKTSAREKAPRNGRIEKDVQSCPSSDVPIGGRKKSIPGKDLEKNSTKEENGKKNTIGKLRTLMGGRDHPAPAKEKRMRKVRGVKGSKGRGKEGGGRMRPRDRGIWEISCRV